MSKIRIYQAGQSVTQGPTPVTTPKYKVILDGKEQEFTDDELDQAWSNIALKNILAQGGIREDDLNKRYTQFKDQAKSGTYSFDVAPSQTLGGSYEGGPANTGTDRRITAAAKVFGVKNWTPHGAEKQMSVINNYLPMQLKQVTQDKEAKLQAEKAKTEGDAKTKTDTDNEKIYNSIAGGYGLGTAMYGSEYAGWLTDPLKMKSNLAGYWDKTEDERRNQMIASGKTFSDIFSLSPEQVAAIETKHAGFTKGRQAVQQYYDPTTQSFKFSTAVIPKFNDIRETYSNAQESMDQDKYLFDRTLYDKLGLTPDQAGVVDAVIPDQTFGSDGTTEATEANTTGDFGEKTIYQKLLANRQPLNYRVEDVQDDSIIRKIFPNYRPSQYKMQILDDSPKMAVFLVDQINPDGSVKMDKRGLPMVKTVTWNKETKSIQDGEEYTSDEVNQLTGVDIEKAINLSKNLTPYLIGLNKQAPGPNYTGQPWPDFQTWWNNPKKVYKEGGIIKAQSGTVIKFRDDKDKLAYVNQLQTQNNISVEKAVDMYKQLVTNGKLVEQKVEPVIPKAAPDQTPLYNTHSKEENTKWHSQTVGNIARDGVDDISDVDWADLATLGLDLVALTPSGPVAQAAGIQSGLTGMYADVQRDGFQPMDQVYGLGNVAVGAQSFIPGIGLLKSQKIAKNVMKLKKLMPVLQTQFTAMGLQGAYQIAKKGIDEGFENISLEDMRMLGGALAGLKNAKNIVKKQGAYEYVALKDNKAVEVEFNTAQGKVKHQIVLDPNESVRVKTATDKEQALKEIILTKVQKDADLFQRVGNVKVDDISLPAKREFKLNRGYNAKLEKGIDLKSEAIRVKAPTDEPTSYLGKLREKVYGKGDVQEARNIDNIRERTVSNQDVTESRLELNKETGKLDIEKGNVEINAATATELESKLKANKLNLEKIKDLTEGHKLETIKSAKETSASKVGYASKQTFVSEAKAEKLSKSQTEELAQLKKSVNELKGDPDMKKNLKTLIAGQETKLAELKQSLITDKTKFKPKAQYSKIQRRLSKGQKQLTEGSPLALKEAQPKNKMEKQKKFLADYEVGKPKKRGRPKKHELGGIILQYDGVKLWQPKLWQPLSASKNIYPTLKEQAQNAFQNAFDMPQTLKSSITNLQKANPGKFFPTKKINFSTDYKWQPKRQSLQSQAKDQILNDITTEGQEEGQKVIPKSGKTWSPGKFNLDKGLALQGAALINSIIANRNQNTNIKAPIAVQQEEFMPTISGNLQLENATNRQINQQGTQESQKQTQDAGINTQSRSQLESKLRDFGAESDLKGLWLRQQKQDRSDQLAANYASGRQQVQNANVSQMAEKENQGIQNKNYLKRNTAELLSGFLTNQAQAEEIKKQKNEGYQDKINEMQMTQDLEANPEYKKIMDQYDSLKTKASKTGYIDNAQDKLEMEEIQKQLNLLYNRRNLQLYKTKISGNPYEAGSFNQQ